MKDYKIDKANRRKRKVIKEMVKALKREKETSEFYRKAFEQTNKRLCNALQEIDALENELKSK